MAARANVPREERTLEGAPLSDGLQRVTVAQERRDQTAQQKGQIVALAAPLARIGHGRKRGGQGAQALVGEHGLALVRAQGVKEGGHGGRRPTDRLLLGGDEWWDTLIVPAGRACPL